MAQSVYMSYLRVHQRKETCHENGGIPVKQVSLEELLKSLMIM